MLREAQIVEGDVVIVLQRSTIRTVFRVHHPQLLAHHLEECVAGGGAVPRLGDYLQRYLNSRTDLKRSSLLLHDMTCRYLLAFFSPETRLDRISRAAASDWRTALTSRKLSHAKKAHERTIRSQATICQHVRR